MNELNFIDNDSVKNVKNKISGKILLAITGGFGIGLTALCIPFITPALRKHCLPYVPATPEQIKNVLSSISKTQKNKILDIGSGDGRIVIAAAKAGHEAHGVELNPWLVQYSRFSAARNGVWNNVKFFRKNLWRFDLSPYNNIVIFGVNGMMGELERKIIKEMTDNSTVIACRFPFPNIKATKTIEAGIDSIWIYNIRNHAIS